MNASWNQKGNQTKRELMKPQMLDPLNPRFFDPNQEPNFEMQSRELHEMNRLSKAKISYLIKESEATRMRKPSLENLQAIVGNDIPF